MGRTNTAPWDYETRKSLKPQIIKLCDECGGYIYWKNGYFCSSCPNTSYVKVYESEVAEFRVDLALAKAVKEITEAEEEVNRLYKKYRLNDELLEAFIEIIERPEYDPAYDREPTDEELRAIEAENEAAEIRDWLGEPPTAREQRDAAYGVLDLDGSDNRPSTQWREHGYY